MTDGIVWEILSWVLGTPREKQVIKLNEQRPWCSQSSKVCPCWGFKSPFWGLCQRGEGLIHLCMVEQSLTKEEKEPHMILKLRPTF